MTNKKKKQKRKAQNQNKENATNRADRSTTTGATASRSSLREPLFDNQGNPANLDGLDEFRRANAHPESKRAGLYFQYKAATQEIHDWYRSVLPTSFRLETVNDFQRAAKAVFQHNRDAVTAVLNLDDEESHQDPILAPDHVFKSLNLCIAYRAKVSATYEAYANNNDGHAHIINVFQYCRISLEQGQRFGLSLLQSTEPEKAQELGNRFAALADDDEDDSVGGDNEDNYDSKIPSRAEICSREANLPPEPPVFSGIMLLEELANGDDRFVSMAFLDTIGDLMDVVQEHYEVAKLTLRNETTDDVSAPQFILMKCSMVLNLAMERIQAMEMEIAVTHPHLNSFYKILALVFLDIFVPMIQKCVEPSIMAEHPLLVREFVGNLTECCFLDKSCPSKMELLVKKFHRTSRMDLSEVEGHAEVLKTMISFEIGLAVDMRFNPLTLALAQQNVTSHQWLKQPSIGKGQSLLNTLYLTQKVFDHVHKDYYVKAWPKNFFGHHWNEDHCPAEQVEGDMDEMFVTDILSELIYLARVRPLQDIPYNESLIPLLISMSKHVKKNPKAPISASMVFGLHAILVSMKVLQGEGLVAKLGELARGSYAKFFEQLDEASQSKSPLAPVFFESVNLIRPLVDLSKPILAYGSRTSEMNGLWNPVIGGNLILLATYLGSLKLGACTIDCFGQLKLTLHLYNALCKNGLLKEDEDAELVGRMDKAFSKSKRIWAPARPERGDFTKCSLLAWGYSAEEANRILRRSRGGRNLKLGFLSKGGRNTRRQTTRLFPETFSESFRRLIGRDFSNDSVNDAILNEDQGKFNELKEILVLVKTVLVSMDEDEENLIPVNLPKVGEIFNDFLVALIDHMGWQSWIKSNVREEAKYRAERGLRGFHLNDLFLSRNSLVSCVFGALYRLDNSDEKYSRKIAAFMRDYFDSTKIRESDYCFFMKSTGDSDVSLVASVSELSVSNPTN